MKIKFSFVVAASPKRNAEVVKSLEKLNYPRKKYEIIVERGPNPSENRNKGIERAKGEIIVFIDDDAIVNSNFLNKAEYFFGKYKKIHIVGGPQLTPKRDKIFAKVSGYALASLFGVGGVRNRYKKGKLNLNADETDLTSANLLSRKEVFKKVKFDSKLWPGEDPKFIGDAKNKGFKVAYCPYLFVFHKRRETSQELAKQIFNYGRMRPKRETFTQTLKKPFFLIPSLFFIYFIFISLLSIAILLGSFIPFAFLFYLPLLLYISLSLFLSFFISLKKGHFTAFFILPFVFFIIHIFYGAGMLYGLFFNFNSF